MKVGKNGEFYMQFFEKHKNYSCVHHDPPKKKYGGLIFEPPADALTLSLGQKVDSWRSW